MSASQSTTTKQSDKFHASDADVTYQSSDCAQFKIHKKNLITYAGGFTFKDSKSEEDKDNIITLEERSDILDLLFQFLYPPDSPNLAEISSETFVALARAAEKYKVYIAMPTCRARMLYVMQRSAALYTRKGEKEVVLKAILEYSIGHRYLEILDELTPFLVVLPLQSTIYLFPSELQTAWALHRDRWVITYQEACFALLMHERECTWSVCRSQTYHLEMGDLFAIEEFMTECRNLMFWKEEVKLAVKSIPKFSSVCSQMVKLA